MNMLLKVDQKVKNKWPLTLINHKGEKEKLFLNCGDMVLYESASIPHGRQFPFNGQYYDNVFVHFTPNNIHSSK